MLAGFIIDKFNFWQLQDNPIFLKRLRDALLSHVRAGHEFRLRFRLRCAIFLRKPVQVIELLDALWLKSISTELNQIETIREFYADTRDSEEGDITDGLMIKSDIRIGVARHVSVVLELINDPLRNDDFDNYSIAKLLEWAISSNFDINKILRNINTNNLVHVKEWNDKHQRFSSQMCQQCQTQSKSVTESIVPNILK